jgi:hypothetical protein
MVTVLEAQEFMLKNYGENAFDGIEVAMPIEMFTEKAIENLHKIVNAKANSSARPSAPWT